MTQREVRLAELKKRIAALDEERAAIITEIATLEQSPNAGAQLPEVASLERVAHMIDRHAQIDQKIALFREMFRGRTEPVSEICTGR